MLQEGKNVGYLHIVVLQFNFIYTLDSELKCLTI